MLYIEGSVLSKLSEVCRPLNILLNGPFKEAQERRVEWPHVDLRTFHRFIQWIYTADYDLPVPSAMAHRQSNETSSTIFPDITQPMKLPQLKVFDPVDVAKYPRERVECGYCGKVTTWAWGQAHGRDGVDASGYAMMAAPVVCRDCMMDIRRAGNCYFTSWSEHRGFAKYSPFQALLKKFNYDHRNSEGPDCTPVENNSTQDFTMMLQSHAKLYALARIWNIETLQGLAMRRFFAILRGYTIFPGHEEEFFGLVKHIFVVADLVFDDPICTATALYFASVESAGDSEWNAMLEWLIKEVPEFGLCLEKVLKDQYGEDWRDFIPIA